MAVAAVLAGCTPAGVKDRMDRAEAVMYAEPDSALALMREIPAGFRGSRDDKARYALLMTEALYKSLHKDNIKVTDDSLIHIAVDYYANDFANLNRVKAYYYQGIIDINNESYAEAIVSMLHAEKSAKELENHLWLGRIYRGIADAFDEVWDKSSALDYYIRALDEFKQDGDNEYIGYGIDDVARSYSNAFQYEKAIEMSNKTIERADFEKNILLKSNAVRLIGKAYLEMGKDSLAVDTYEKLFSFGPEYIEGQDWLNLGLSYVGIGNLDKAKSLNDSLQKYVPGDKWLTLRIDYIEGNYRNAFDILREELLAQNDLMRNILKRNFSKVIGDYYALQESESEKKISREKTEKILIAVICCLCMFIGVFYFIQERKEYRREVEHNMLVAKNLRAILSERETELQQQKATISNLSEESQSKNCELHNLQSKISEREKVWKEAQNEIKGLLASSFDTIDRLCATYYQYNGLGNEQEKVYQKVMSMIDGMKLNQEMLDKFEATLNRHLNGVVERFKETVPGLNELEISLFIYQALGLSSRAISVFQQVKIDLVYSRKYVLKRKIKASKSPFTDEFLGYFES